MNTNYAAVARRSMETCARNLRFWVIEVTQSFATDRIITGFDNRADAEQRLKFEQDKKADGVFVIAETVAIAVTTEVVTTTKKTAVEALSDF